MPSDAPLQNFGGVVTTENPYGFTDDTTMADVDGNDTEMFGSLIMHLGKRALENPGTPIPKGHFYELEA